jgi:hypothetical protein
MPDDTLTRFILPASQYIAQEIGSFLPVLETVKVFSDDDELLTPPILRLTGNLDNDGTTVESTDVYLRATQKNDRRAWPYGPYFRIDPLELASVAWADEVSIPAAWGLYERVEALGVTLSAEQSATAETLTVADGGKLSPGMMLKIGDEMQFVRETGAPTAAVTTLGAAMDASEEEITLASGALVKVGEIIRVDFERLKVLDIAGNKVYVTRGWQRTKKASHTSGTAVDVYRAYQVRRACNGTSAAIQASAAAISRFVVPEDVHYLTRQITTLMSKKAATGYAGRAGNPESGESYFMYEFPREAIERVKKNYYVPAVR